MSLWSSYSVEDFLLFSERTYWRLFELHNEAFWPAHLFALLAGLALVALLVRPRSWSGRGCGLILAVAWLVTAWSYFWQSYATINWAAVYVAPVFVAQALLLAALSGRLALSTPGRSERIVGLALLVWAVALHPLLAAGSGRPLVGAEVFALAPDPTAIATLGLLVLAGGGWRRWLLLVVPAGWCGISAIVLLTLGSAQGWVPLAAAGLALATLASAVVRRQGVGSLSG